MRNLKSVNRGVAELAIFGGEPLFVKSVAVGRPNTPDIERVIDDIRTVLSSGRLTNNGPFLREFEEEICGITGVEHCIAVCNATAALQLAARAMGLEGEVIVPSFTFIATAHALSWQGMTPVFVDVDPVSHTIDPAKIEAAITPATSSICGVHLWGNVCDVPALQDIADKHKLELWFDATHAFAVAQKGIRVGNFGRAEVFSFHASKFINAFEGGAIVTNDADLAQTIRKMRGFGLAENGEVTHLGINAKMSEASAAMGLTSLRYLDQTQAVNRRNFERYKELLQNCLGIQMRAPLDPDGSNCQYVACEVDEKWAGLSRDQLLTVLEAEGICAKRYFNPGCHRAAPYNDGHLQRQTPLPMTEQLAHTVLVLPTGSKISIEDVEQICGLIEYAIESSAQILDELACRRQRMIQMRGPDPVLYRNAF